MGNPKVTILMPVYNGETYLAEAIESVLNQTFEDFEFLIINDGSTDRTVEITKEYNDSRIRMVNNQCNLKLITTLNKGLELARGKYIARIDADDIMLPQRLEFQTQYLDANPHICVIGSWWKNIGEQSELLGDTRVPVSDYECAFMIFEKGENPVGHPCVMYRANIISEIGYSSEYADAEDVDLWFQVICHGHRLANIPEVLTLYRQHREQVCERSVIQEEKHEKALSNFVSEQLGRYVEPREACLLRPINMDNTQLNGMRQISRMLRLKREMLNAFFEKYDLSLSQVVRCIVLLWDSLIPVTKVTAIGKLHGFWIGTKLCLEILKNQMMKHGTFRISYFIQFIISVSIIIVKRIEHKFLPSLTTSCKRLY